MSYRAHRLGFITAVFVIAGVPIIAALFNLATPFVPYGSFGFVAGFDGTITSIWPRTTAAEIGLKPGDRFDVLALSPKQRIYVYWDLTLAGRRATFLLSKGPARAVTLVAYPPERDARRGAWAIYNVMNPVLALFDIAIVLIAASLVLDRPTRTTWAFLFYAAGWRHSSILLTALLPPMWAVAFLAYSGILWVGSPAALVIFALRFPTDRVRGVSAIVDRWLPWLPLAIAPLVAAAPALWVYRGLGTHALDQALMIAVIALYCFAVVAFIGRYFAEGPGERQRTAWVLASFLVGFSWTAATRISESVGLSMPASLYTLLSTSVNLAVPIAVTNALVKQYIASRSLARLAQL